MNNVNDILTFTLSGAPAGGGGYTYVWKWWDSTVNTTIVPSVEKQLNMGGTLDLSITQCDQFGQNQVYTGSVVVNFPPVIIGSPSVSNNDTAFPYDTLLRSFSYDPEHPGSTELTFAWYNGPTLISSGTTVETSGTYMNQLGVYGVSTDLTLTQIITDTLNGVTKVNYFLRGFAPSGLQGSSSSISNSIVSSANNLSEIIIGPGVETKFTAYAQDTSVGQLQFFWSAGTLNGWSTTFQETDTPEVLDNGLFRSQITLPISSELPGLKTVLCTVTNLQTAQSISFNNTINLIAASPPTITSISTDAPVINGGYAVSQSGFVHFSASAADPNNALLSYKWSFSQPNLVLYGRTVMLRPADYSLFDETTLLTTGPLPIVGQVTVTDRFNQSSTVDFNQFVTTLVWSSTQVSPQTSGTGSTTLQKRYWGVSEVSSLELNDLTSLNSDFSSQRNQSNTFNPADQYMYIAYPSSFGQAAAINVNGSIATDWLLTVTSFNSVLYNVYRSATPLTGAFQVVIN